MFTSRKGTIASIAKCKCPRCHEGDLFVNKNPYTLRHFLDMPDRCPLCGQDFRIEPGFYLGAMWISYPVVIFLLIAFIAFAHFSIGLHMIGSFVVAILFLLPVFPPLIRYSRVLFLYIFAGD